MTKKFQDVVNDELERVWGAVGTAHFKVWYCPDIYLKILRKTTQNLCQDSQPPCQDSL
jgi:hypothetical protein